MTSLSPSSPSTAHRVIGRYAIHHEIASGGMATVHLGRLLGEAGFSRTVAIKRLHEHLAKDPDFVAMFLDEARLASRVRHPNVVSILDVVVLDKEVFLVMDYVQGASVSRLARSARTGDKRIPPKITLSIMVGALHGLHAAHEAIGENGQSLGIVHRDVLADAIGPLLH
ncbi:MAG TPA: protein kinase, partial [Polyangiaceae bacterium]|nr:protein kinase [Polyangiaceae bacterium]